jgi:AcrR family transcriptional regulator
MSTAPPRSGRGRPPDPDLEARVFAATLELYGELGWAGFSLDVLARRARVGKAALYSRWGSKERLIVEALASWASDQLGTFHDSGALRRDLINLATRILDGYVGREGLVMLRAQIEAKVYPDLFGQAMEDLGRRRTRIGRAIVLAGIARGELPEGTSPALVLDAVAGIVTNHVLATPAGKLPALAARSGEYAEGIVDFVLSAVGYRPPGRADSEPT